MIWKGKSNEVFSFPHWHKTVTAIYIVLFGGILIRKEIGRCYLQLEVKYRPSLNRINTSFWVVLKKVFGCFKIFNPFWTCVGQILSYLIQINGSSENHWATEKEPISQVLYFISYNKLEPLYSILNLSYNARKQEKNYLRKPSTWASWQLELVYQFYYYYYYYLSHPLKLSL